MSARIPFSAFSLALSLLLTDAASVFAYVGQWQTYADKGRVTALVAHEGYVYAGTQGGIRRVQPGSLAQKDYGNLDGLLDPWITGFAEDASGGLWSVAHDGYLYALQKGGAGWDVYGRSYASQGWQMNDRAVLAAGSRFFLGSQKGLTLFDTDKKMSVLNLTRFGSDLDLPVLSLLRRGDTLYVGTTAGVYKTRVYFADPVNPPANSGYSNLADHSQWLKDTLATKPGRAYDFMAFIGDSLATFGPGTLLQAPAQAPVRVEAFAGSPLRIGAHVYTGAPADFIAAVAVGTTVFMGGNSGLGVSVNPLAGTQDASAIAPLKAHSREPIANIDAKGGVVWGYSAVGLHGFNGAAKFFGEPAVVEGEAAAVIQRSLRNLRIDANGDVYLGTWGDGLNRFRNGQKTSWKADPGGSNCIHQAFPPNDPWTVVSSLSRPVNGSLYFSVFGTENSGDHQLVHLNTQTEQVTCLTVPISGGSAHAVEIFADTLVAVASNNGVTFLYVREGPSGPTLDSAALWTVPSANEAWDLAKDTWGRPWTIIGDQLAVADSLGLSNQHRLTAIENFIGRDCRNLEADPAGYLWVGCGNGLFHVRTAPTGELTSVRRYGIDDGLPSLLIYDVSVDPSDGRVWVATSRGVATFESASQPVIPRGNLGVVIPYPNPFRPQHAFVIFDKLPEGSTLRIHDPAGHVVRIFHPREMRGSQAQWDGRNESGKPVRPGVYLFSVTSGSTVQRGKVIVAR